MTGSNGNVLLQVVPAVLVLAIVVIATARHYSARQKQAQGILWLQALRTLLTHIQRHRGLSSGYLSGDLSLKPGMESVQDQVSRDFVLISGIGDWIADQPEWQEITKHWARLAGQLTRLRVERSIDQHTRLIKNILVLVDEIAVRHYLGSQPSFRASLWRDLLGLAELIGQLRAAGTVICAQRDENSERVDASIKSVQRLSQEVLNFLEEPRCRHGLPPALLQEILDFLAYMDAAVLNIESDVSATSFYARATDTIDALYTQFDHALHALNRVKA